MGAAIQLKRLGYDDLVILGRRGRTTSADLARQPLPRPGRRHPVVDVLLLLRAEPHWSRLFAPGPELKAYAVHVADKYDLRRHMRFDTVVQGARWDEESSTWQVTLEGGETVAGRFLLTATGFPSPSPGCRTSPASRTSPGTVVHTTRWDDDIELEGKRIGIIGTGATAVQLIPELAKVADHLTVYQRTPIYVSPKLDGPVPGVVRGAFAKVPLTQKATRLVGTSILELLMVAGVLHFRDLPAANQIGKPGLRGAPQAPGEGPPSCARSCGPTTTSAASGRPSPTPTSHVHPGPRGPGDDDDRPRRRDRDRDRRRRPRGPRRPRAGDRVQPCGTPTSPRSRSSAARAATRQVVAREIQRLTRASRAEVPRNFFSLNSPYSYWASLLHHHRDPDGPWSGS